MKGPFVAKKKDSEERFVIRKSEFMQFGEYEMEEKSFVAFSANDIDRKIFIPGVNELPSPHIIDFISDEDLLKEFEIKIKGSSNDYNIDVLNSFIEFIQKSRLEINNNAFVRRNERLLAIIDAGKNEILSNIDFINRLPQMTFVTGNAITLIDYLSCKAPERWRHCQTLCSTFPRVALLAMRVRKCEQMFSFIVQSHSYFSCLWRCRSQ